MQGVYISYGDFAPDAKESFQYSGEKALFIDFSVLNRYNEIVDNVGNPCEDYLVPLDGSMSLFTDAASFGYWSEQVTDADGDFSTPVVLTAAADNYFSSSGFTFTFDTNSGIFPREIGIAWYDGNTLLDSLTFEPDSPFFYCENRVENYDKVVFSFPSLNLPHNRLRIRSIDFGRGTIFSGAELSRLKVTQQIDPLSTEISINVADITIKPGQNEYSFQERQPLTIYYNDDIVQMVFVKSFTRTGKNQYNISGEDYIGLMDGITFVGDVYDAYPLVDLFDDIFTAANVPYEIESIDANELFSGHIPYTTCREALMQAAFRAQCVVDTSNSNVVRVYRPSNVVSQTVALDRIKQGQNFTDETTVTGVEIYAHSYAETNETITVFHATADTINKDVRVVFDEPLFDLAISGNYGTIIEHSANYAVVNITQDGAFLYGKKYEHTTTAHTLNNPYARGDTEKIASVQNATLISVDAVDDTLAACYAYYLNTQNVNGKIVDRRHATGGEFAVYGAFKYGEAKYGSLIEPQYDYDTPVNVGDYITAETEYLGNITGRVISASFGFLGGVLTEKQVVIK